MLNSNLNTFIDLYIIKINYCDVKIYTDLKKRPQRTSLRSNPNKPKNEINNFC